MKKWLLITVVVLVLGAFVFFVREGNLFFGRTSIIHDGIDDDPFAIDSGVKILKRRSASVNISFNNPMFQNIILADAKAEPEVQEESVTEEKIETKSKEIKKKKGGRKKVRRKKKKPMAESKIELIGSTTLEIIDLPETTSAATTSAPISIDPIVEPKVISQPTEELSITPLTPPEIPVLPASITGTSTEPVQPEEPEDIFEFSEWFNFQDYGKTVNPGDILRYKILVQNQGKEIETNFFVEADIPAGTELAGESIRFELKQGKFSHKKDQGKIIVLLEDLPPDEVFEMSYEVTVQKEKGNIEHRGRITRNNVTIAETVPLINPLPEPDEARMQEICFSKQYRKDLLEKTLQPETAFDAEQELRKIFVGMPEAVEYFLKHRFDNEMRENFLRSLIALPCVQVPADYPLPEWVNKKVEIQTQTFVAPSPQGSITVGTATLPLGTSSFESGVGTSTESAQAATESGVQLELGTTTNVGSSTDTGTTTLFLGTSSPGFKAGTSTNLGTSTLEIIPAPTATESATAPPPEPVMFIPQEENLSTGTATSTEDYTSTPPHTPPEERLEE